MDFTNIHQQNQQLQDQLVGSSIPASLSPCLSVANNDHAWRRTPTFFLNNSNIHATSSETSPDSLNNSIIQDMGISWPNNISIQSASHHDHPHLFGNKLKEESSTSSDQSGNSSTVTRFSDILSPSTSPSEILLLKTLSPTYRNYMLQPSPFQPSMEYHDNSNKELPSLEGSKRMTTFSQIFPSVNISSMSNKGMPSVLASCSSPMQINDVQGSSDLFATGRFLNGESLHQAAPSSNLLELLKGSSQFGADHDLQQSSDLRQCDRINNNLSSFDNNGALESERLGCIMEPKFIHQTASKKQRFEPRSSCPPLKVRKEKLGDRIAALQQLVAPFGKTDTASVLMEAIGYIKFLQNQVETLSVPYMKLASRNKSAKNIKRVSDENSESVEQKPELRSRGLCLVPLSCMSYITSDVVWQPPNFNPGSDYSPSTWD